MTAAAWTGEEAEHLRDIDAQLNFDERQLLYWLAKQDYTGRGEIIDAGAFLGGSAICLATGLRENQSVPEADKSGRIHSYDFFRSGKWIADKWFDGDRVPDGESIRWMYDRNVGDLVSYINVYEGDITKRNWSEKEIEILFLDVCKTVSINDYVTRMFFPNLIPDRSVVVQQDYDHLSANIWIYITLERLRDHFELMGKCWRNSAAYRLRKPISDADLDRAMVGPLSHEERMEVAVRAANRWPAETKERLLSCVEDYRELSKNPNCGIL